MQTLRSVRLGWVLLVGLVWLSASGVAFGHAHLDTSVPLGNSTVTERPSQVVLRFTEPVEVNFSTFKVYPLQPDDDMLRLRAQASTLVSQSLQQRGDEAARADAGVTTNARISAEVQLAMKEDLAPGPYVVMWRVLSVDTHITQGFYIFHYDG